MRKLLNTSQMLTSNGLAMVCEIPKLIRDLKFPALTGAGGATRKLLAKDGFPSWVSFRQRMLLQQNPSHMKPNVVVAKYGCGKYKSINQALKEVPKNNASPFVIHIKAGVYNEQVLVDKYMSNFVFIGDEPTNTIVTSHLNFIDGTSTFKSATAAVIGTKFMARGIGFENTAGGIKHQAVALKVQGDKAIFHNCQMDGYQDCKLYRECTVTGTVDYIFGNSATIIQNCKLIS
ncbi:hypothetical protein like AT3G05610 [Hibiscus trionum]|uniref:Pectinesterase n=1 Tax=Hibiscus trionum TaxID=183268 RepID=A0A9W7LHP4_HIBTR|nr:hypothetical protein like AT3G05610 [Hibiscus trionum]